MAYEASAHRIPMIIIHQMEGILFILYQAIKWFVPPKVVSSPIFDIKFLSKMSLHSLENVSDRYIFFRNPIELMDVI